MTWARSLMCQNRDFDNPTLRVTDTGRSEDTLHDILRHILYNFKFCEPSLEFAARSRVYQALLGFIKIDDVPDGIEVLKRMLGL